MNNIEVIQLNKYTAPTVVEDVSKEWVKYIVQTDVKGATRGDFDLGRAKTEELYYSYLDKRYDNSPTNQALIDQISRLIYGKGIDALDSNQKPGQFAQMLNLVPKKDLKRMIHDRKKYGFGAFQIQYKNKLISRISHVPSRKLLSGVKNDKNKVVNWFYSDDWNNPKLEPVPMPLFGTTNNSKTELYIFAPYSSGDDYYSLPEYSGSLGYALLEEKICEYLINDVTNGFSGTKVVNFNNGVPPKDKREAIKNEVTTKLTGSTGDKVIIAFNKTSENATTVENIPLDDAPRHYEYLSDECEKKLLRGHKAPSWLLGANNGGQGLSSNADEIKNQMLVFDNFVIKSYQEEILDGLEEILSVNGINLNLYFKTLQPLEFIGIDVEVDDETIEEETGVEQSKTTLNSHVCNVKLSKDYDELDDLRLADELINSADDDLDGWELIDERDVDYDLEDKRDEFIKSQNEKHRAKSTKKTLLNKISTMLVSTGIAKPNASSEQDIDKKDVEDALYKVRYRYAPDKVGSNSRAFCKAMIRAKKIYRKEDIVRLNDVAVNPGFGPDGAATYSIWLYKGGPLCHHRWLRQTYRFVGRGKKSGDVKSPNAKKVAGFANNNPREVAQRPRDMKYKGFKDAETMKRFLGL